MKRSTNKIVRTPFVLRLAKPALWKTPLWVVFIFACVVVLCRDFLWDVTAIAWLLNDNDRFMLSRIVPTPNPIYDGLYAIDHNGDPMAYIYHIKRDALMNDLINKITK